MYHFFVSSSNFIEESKISDLEFRMLKEKFFYKFKGRFFVNWDINYNYKAFPYCSIPILKNSLLEAILVYSIFRLHTLCRYHLCSMNDFQRDLYHQVLCPILSFIRDLVYKDELRFSFNNRMLIQIITKRFNSSQGTNIFVKKRNLLEL